MAKKVIRVLLALGLAYLLVFVIVDTVRTPTDEEMAHAKLLAAEAADKVEPVPYVETVDAVALIADYSDNELAADKHYRGKTLRVDGFVGAISKDLNDQPYVLVRTKKFQVRGVQCFLTPTSLNLATQLVKGQSVMVRGTVTGLMVNVIVRPCDLTR